MDPKHTGKWPRDMKSISGSGTLCRRGGGLKVKGVYFTDVIYGQKWGYVWGWTPRATGDSEIKL